eukprot:560558-Rhodomonas_salina.2
MFILNYRFQDKGELSHKFQHGQALRYPVPGYFMFGKRCHQFLLDTPCTTPATECHACTRVPRTLIVAESESQAISLGAVDRTPPSRSFPPGLGYPGYPGMQSSRNRIRKKEFLFPGARHGYQLDGCRRTSYH